VTADSTALADIPFAVSRDVRSLLQHTDGSFQFYFTYLKKVMQIPSFSLQTRITLTDMLFFAHRKRTYGS
jgi:hypothetical protein